MEDPLLEVPLYIQDWFLNSVCLVLSIFCDRKVYMIITIKFSFNCFTFTLFIGAGYQQILAWTRRNRH